MRLSLSFFLLIVTSSSLATNYECIPSTEWPDERSFSANVLVLDKKVKVSNLLLSEEWPLPKSCDKPNISESAWYKRNLKVDEIGFGPYSNNECGYVYSINFGKEGLSLLHVFRSKDEWGESPYIAECHVL